MQFDIAQCVNKGMQRDYSMDKASQEFAYENRNIRITTTGNNSFLSVSNEKSTELVVDLYSLKLYKKKFKFDDNDSISECIIELEKEAYQDVLFNIKLQYGSVGLEEVRQIKIESGAKVGSYVINPEEDYIKRYYKDDTYEIIPVLGFIINDNDDYYDSEHDLYSEPLVVIGNAVIGDYLILFIKDKKDRILKVDLETGNIIILYVGDLNFSVDAPIECITSYESDNVQKVYWVDGINQPRYINIAVEIIYPEYETFNFVPIINKDITVSIEKQNVGAGNFESGIVQYYITGYRKYGAESNALYTSPLYYISPSNRGGKPGDIQTCSFKLTIDISNTVLDNIRIYSVVRNSKNAIPLVKIVQDLNIDTSANNVIVIDTNMGTPVASTDVMFLGGNTITAKTIEQKDNTLFLGNIESKATSISNEDIISYITEDNFELGFGLKAVFTNPANENIYYPYTPNMNGSSEDITTFKYLEWYRFGIQFQLDTLEWTQTYFLKDIQNRVKPNADISTHEIYNPFGDKDNLRYFTMVYCKLSETLLDFLKKKNIVGWRLMLAQHDTGTRTIKAQGLVLPTQFNLRERFNEQCYSTPIWSLGQCLHGYHYVNIDNEQYPNEVVVPPLAEINYNKSLTSAMLPITAYYNSNASTSNYLANATILHNLFCTKKQIEFTNYYAVSITPYITVDRLYTWDSEWDIWDLGTGDIFYAELDIKVSDGKNISTYRIGKSTTYKSNKDCSITSVFKLYGDRKNGCNNLSSNLKALTWSNIGDYYIQGLKDSKGNTVKVKNLENYVGANKLFLSGEIPEGSTIRDWTGISDEVWNKSLGELARDFSFNTLEGIKDNYGNNFFLDANICNFISPDKDNVKEDMSFRIVGSVEVENVISDYNITVENSVVGTSNYKAADWIFHNYKCRVSDNISYFTGITSYPLWPYNNRLYFINYWNHAGSIIGEDGKLKLKTKKFANMWYLSGNKYFDSVIDYSNVNSLISCKNNTSIISSHIYKPQYENVLFPHDGIYSMSLSNKGYPINESFPLQYVDDLITDGDSFDVYKSTNTINIKSKSSDHITFILPAEFNCMMEVLPNYGIKSDGQCDAFGNTNSKMLNINRAILITSDCVSEDAIEIFRDIGEYGNIKVDIYNYKHLSSFDIFLNDKKVISPARNSSVRVVECDFLNGESYDMPFIDNVSGSYTDDLIILEVPTEFGIEEYGLYFEKGITISNGNKGNCKLIKANSGVYNFAHYIGVGTDTSYCKGYYSNRKLKELENTILNSKQTNVSSKLFIGEFYVPYNPDTFMGGESQNAKELNVYIPISGIYNTDIINSGGNKYAIGYGLEGDTYFQRWDHVRISPISDTDINQPLDALSIELEAYSNLDGDYRTLRGRLDVTNLNEENTNNLINEVYSQSNNYITSSVLDEKFNTFKYDTMYMWSLPKKVMEDIDNWTQIRLSSANSLDGDKGVLTKIINWNNKLLAFQEKGISIINYNNQTTLSQNEGVPVEIANSGRVTGHYYISTSQGCKNKWSIVSSPYSLYFIDSYNKSINAFNEKITPLSTTNLFSDWIIQNEHDTLWKPNGNPDLGFRSYYDAINKDVYFVNGEYCLCYNELLSQFTSFYDYEKMDSLNAVNGHVYSICDSKLYKMFEGKDYCNLFGKQSSYYMTYKINKDPFIDKTWTNIEYRADVFDSGIIGHQNAIISEPLKTFDNFEVWNEYQHGKSDMSKAKCKFRIWREQIPRDTKEDKRGFNRIRNPWIMLKLEKTKDTDKRMEFHDLLIKYLR